MRFILVSVFLIALGVCAVSAAPNPNKSPNFQNEFDQFLFAYIEEHIYRADEKMLHLQYQFSVYFENPNDELKAKIKQEINTEIPLLESSLEETKTQLKRTDYNEFEKYMVERMSDDLKLLVKYYTLLNARLK